MKDSAAEINLRGELVGWVCKYCKLYNDILTDACKACYCYKPEWLTTEVQIAVEIKRGVFFHYGLPSESDLLEDNMAQEDSMTDEEKLFRQYYSAEKVSVHEMDDITLREHRAKLVQVIIEAKARVRACDDTIRERNAKNKQSKEWLQPVNGDPNASDAIRVVETRKKRMNKIERLKHDLSKTITDPVLLDKMIKDLEKGATEKQLDTITFKSTKTVEITKTVEVKPEENKPFNFGGIKFGS